MIGNIFDHMRNGPEEKVFAISSGSFYIFILKKTIHFKYLTILCNNYVINISYLSIKKKQYDNIY